MKLNNNQGYEKKKILLIAYTAISYCKAQVGIYTTDTKATLDIRKTNQPSFSEGIKTPQLSRTQLTEKGDNYDVLHKSTLIYVHTIDGAVNEKTEHVTKTGYYVFNGTQWKYLEEKIKYFTLPDLN